MPAKAPVTSIECTSLHQLLDEIASIQDALTRTETEETWEAIGRALSRFAALCNGNASNYPTDLTAALRASSRPITSALNSERTRLSGTAAEFIKTSVDALGRAFEPLIPQYFPTLLILCTRANKVFVTRAKECIHAVIEHTQSPSLLHYLAESIKDKSVSLRLASAEAVMLCLNSFNPPDLEKEPRAKDIEAIIRATAVDANADVRKVARKIFDAYKILLPRRVKSFTDPLSPTIRKYLDIKSVAANLAQPPSRPASSQSIRSAHSDNNVPSHAAPARPQPSTQSTTASATRPSKHTRTASASSTAAKRPARTPTPEFSAPVPVPPRDPPRRAREEPKRLAKLDMPPPDYIPTHTGPQRPLSASDLYFPHHAPPLERVPSGPQRIALADPVGSGAPPTVRSGPIRPVMKPSQGSVEDAAEKKERILGGARRVLRLPDAAESALPAEEARKPTGATSGPIRPRVISTSKSTPAVPMHAAVAAAREREDALKAKRLASSQGAGAAGVSTKSTSGAGAAAAPPTAAQRHVRIPSGGVQSSTASARARAAERAQEKKAPVLARKPSSKTLPQPKPAVPARAGSTGPPTVTVRDRTRTASGPNAKAGAPAPPSKAAGKDVKVVKAATGAKSRAATQEPPSRAQSVAPAEVPLPESPKGVEQPRSVDVTPDEDVAAQKAAAPKQTQSPPPEVEEVSPAVAEPAPEHDQEPEQKSEPLLIDFDTSLPSPANVPLPASKPSSPFETPTPPSEQLEEEPIAATATTTYPVPKSPEPPCAPPSSDPMPVPVLPEPVLQEARTPEQQRTAHHHAVEQTPISALVASIEREFFAIRSAPLSPMREEDEGEGESVLVEHHDGPADPDAAVFDDAVGVSRTDAGLPVRAVQPLFARRGRQVLHA
ncbi:clasp N terminal-domain-containing protein [Lenzites betulinus]|nr:clasp N terminal-domain-containing protein [Lenzites betulinus]